MGPTGNIQNNYPTGFFIQLGHFFTQYEEHIHCAGNVKEGATAVCDPTLSNLKSTGKRTNYSSLFDFSLLLFIGHSRVHLSKFILHLL